MSKDDDVLDLKNEIITLKKENGSLKSENNLLKVKIRKLLNELQRRNKQTETLINPKKNGNLKHLISEAGATMILQQKEDNLRLEKLLLEKEMTIKRLHNELKMRKIYGLRYKERQGLMASLSQKLNEVVINKNIDVTVPPINSTGDCGECGRNSSKKPRSKYKKVSKHNVSRLTSASNISQTSRRDEMTSPSFHSFSEESDASLPFSLRKEIHSTENYISNIEDYMETQFSNSHEEIKELQLNFVEMLTEIKNLKTTISQMRRDQDTHHETSKEIKYKKCKECRKLPKKSASLPENFPRGVDEKHNQNENNHKVITSNTMIQTDQSKISPSECKGTDCDEERLKRYHQLLQNISEVSESSIASERNEEINEKSCSSEDDLKIEVL